MRTVKGNLLVPVIALITVKFFLPVCSSMVYLPPETKLWTKPTHCQLWQRCSSLLLLSDLPVPARPALPLPRVALPQLCTAGKRLFECVTVRSEKFLLPLSPRISAQHLHSVLQLNCLETCYFIIWVVAALPLFSKTHKAFWSSFLRCLSNAFTFLMLVFTVLNLEILDCDPQKKKIKNK